jgi:hypothetical protein
MFSLLDVTVHVSESHTIARIYTHVTESPNSLAHGNTTKSTKILVFFFLFLRSIPNIISLL